MRCARVVLSALLLAAPAAAFAEPPAPPAASPPAPAAGPVLLDDFSDDPADRWKARNLSMTETIVAAGTTPSSGGILEIGLAGKGGSIERPVEVADWRGFDALSLHVAVEADREQPLRVVVLSGKPSRGLVRRFKVEPGPWRAVVLPLKDFREDGGDLLGSFAAVERVRIQWDEGKGKVRLDDLRLLPGARGAASCRMTNEDRLRLAFPAGDGKVSEGEGFAVFTNVPQLHGDKAKPLLARLEEVPKVLAERFAIRGEPEDRVPLHVFRTRAEYEGFVARLADHFGAKVGAPEGDGFTVFATPSSTWDAKQGWDRPVYVHEAAHGFLCRVLGISSNGNWVQEGLATAVQARIHPKSVVAADLATAFRRRAAGEKGSFAPWKDLLYEKRPAIRSYAQLLTVFEFLAARHGPALPRVWTALSQAPKPLSEGGIALVADALGTPLEDLERGWLAWGAETYAK